MNFYRIHYIKQNGVKSYKDVPVESRVNAFEKWVEFKNQLDTKVRFDYIEKIEKLGKWIEL